MLRAVSGMLKFGRLPVLAGLFFCCAVFPLTMRATTLNMDVLPTALGWGNYTCSSPGASNTVSGGVLTMVSPTCDEFQAPAADWNAVVSPTTAWYVEARVRLDSGSTLPFCNPVPQCVYSNTGGLRLWMNDNQNLTTLDIATDGVYLNTNPGVIYALDTSQFHTYRVDGFGKSIRLSIDGTLVATSMAEFSGTTGFFFGDGAIDAATVSEWDYVTIQAIPEPSMGLVVLVVLAGGLCVRVRRPLHSIRVTRRGALQ